jgi:hypothetical protein
LKVAPLLAQYLYTYKRLDLPGLGIFSLDSSVVLETESNKRNTPVNLEGVSFENMPSIKEAPELIQFISSQTGKIKALASADLISYLGEAQQFLNIGKPFLFEGIGSLTKIRSGEFAFTPGPAIALSIKEVSAIASRPDPSAEKTNTDYKSVFYQRKVKKTWQKPVAIILLVAGLGLAIWGGFTVYKRTTANNNKLPVKKQKENPVQVADTAIKQTDSLDVPKSIAVTPSATTTGNFKFVIETAGKERALARYNKLKGFGLDVQIETRDSSVFKLFFVLPAVIADTARMLDSLRGIYTPPGSSAYVEQ